MRRPLGPDPASGSVQDSTRLAPAPSGQGSGSADIGRFLPSVGQGDRLVERVERGARIALEGLLSLVDDADADLLEDLLVDLDQQLGVLDEEALGVLPPLAELLTLVGEPRP